MSMHQKRLAERIPWLPLEKGRELWDVSFRMLLATAKKKPNWTCCTLKSRSSVSQSRLLGKFRSSRTPEKLHSLPLQSLYAGPGCSGG